MGLTALPPSDPLDAAVRERDGLDTRAITLLSAALVAGGLLGTSGLAWDKLKEDDGWAAALFWFSSAAFLAGVVALLGALALDVYVRVMEDRRAIPANAAPVAARATRARPGSRASPARPGNRALPARLARRVRRVSQARPAGPRFPRRQGHDTPNPLLDCERRPHRAATWWA